MFSVQFTHKCGEQPGFHFFMCMQSSHWLILMCHIHTVYQIQTQAGSCVALNPAPLPSPYSPQKVTPWDGFPEPGTTSVALVCHNDGPAQLPWRPF